MTSGLPPAHVRAWNVLRTLFSAPDTRVLPPRNRNTLSLLALRRGVFMLKPRLRCTVCGRARVRPSSIPLWKPLQWMGLSAYRCLDCDHRLVLPFRDAA